MEIPVTKSQAGELVGDVFEAVALNQVRTDREILQDIYSNLETKENQSAIKIGDVWLSIPAKILSIYAAANGVKKWWSFRKLQEIDETQPADRKVLDKLGIKSEVSRDPLEKLVGFSTNAENNVSVSPSLGAPSAVVVERNKPGDLVFNLTFHCTPFSIQNNIRPLMAQFALAPFLPCHNGDLQRIVTPADENPDVYLLYNKGYLNNDGEFRFGPSTLEDYQQLIEKMASNDALNDDAFRNAGESGRQFARTFAGDDPLSKMIRELQPDKLQDYLETKAYWEVPFFLQLIDFTISSIKDKKNSFELTLIVRAVTTAPSYGSIPLYIKTEAGVKNQLQTQKALEYAYKGDNELIDKISRMLQLEDFIDVDGPLHLTAEENLSSYNLLDKLSGSTDFFFQNDLNRIGVPKNNGNYNDVMNHAMVLRDDTINKAYCFPYVFSRDKFNDTEVKKMHVAWYEPGVPKDGPVILVNNANSKLETYSVTDELSNNPLNEFIPYIDSKRQLETSGVPNYGLKFTYKRNPKFDPEDPNVDNQERDTLNYLHKKEIKVVQYNMKNLHLPEEDGLDDKFADPRNRVLYYGRFFSDPAAGAADIIIMEEMSRNGKILEIFKDMLNSDSAKARRAPLANNKPDTVDYESYTFNAGTNPQTIAILSKIPISLSESDLIHPETLAPGIKLLGFGPEGSARPDINVRPIIKLTLKKTDNNKIVVFCCHFKARNSLDPELSDTGAISEQIRKYESIALMNAVLLHNKANPNIPYMVVGDMNYGYYEEPKGTDNVRFMGFSNLIAHKNNSDPNLVEVEYREIANNSLFVRKNITANLLPRGSAEDPNPPNQSALFGSTLDLILCEDPELMRSIATDVDKKGLKFLSVNMDSWFYRSGSYGNTLKQLNGTPEQKFKEIRPLIMYNALTPRFTASGVLANDLVAYRKNYGTFFDEASIAALKDAQYVTLDHIFYSYHFFDEKSSVSFTPDLKKDKIIDVYYDGFEQFFSEVDPDTGKIKWRISTRLERYGPGPGFSAGALTDDERKEFDATGKVTVTTQRAIRPSQDKRTERIAIWRGSVVGTLVTGLEFNVTPEYSDHFPITSTFLWDIRLDNANPLVASATDQTTPRLFEGKEYTTLPSPVDGIPTKIEQPAKVAQFEILPYIYISKEQIQRALDESVLKTLKASTKLLVFEHPDFYQVGLISAIVFSKALGKYVFIVNYHLRNAGYGTAMVVSEASPGVIDRAIVAIKNDNNVGAAGKLLIDIYLLASAEGFNNSDSFRGVTLGAAGTFTNFQGEHLTQTASDATIAAKEGTNQSFYFNVSQKTKTTFGGNGDVQLDTSGSPILTGTTDFTRKGAGIEKINPNRFVDYFIYGEPSLNGVSPLGINDVTSNISDCQPFRNYYLPLLTEFSDASVLSGDFEYTYLPETYEPFITDFDIENSFASNTDYRVMFTRKLTKKYGRSIIARIAQAISLMIQLGDGTDEQRSKFLGTLAHKILNQGSLRIPLIIAEQRSKFPSKTVEDVKRDLLDNIGTPGRYRNVLYAEVMIYIASKISLLYYFVDADFENFVINHLDTIAAFKLTGTDLYRGNREDTIKAIRDEINFLAFAGLTKTTNSASVLKGIQALKPLNNERAKVVEYLKVEFEYIRSIATRQEKYGDKDKDFQEITGDIASRVDINQIKNQALDLNAFIVLFKTAVENLVNVIFEHIKPDSTYDGRFEENF
jgi:hypothetical protein